MFLKRNRGVCERSSSIHEAFCIENIRYTYKSNDSLFIYLTSVLTFINKISNRDKFVKFRIFETFWSNNFIVVHFVLFFDNFDNFRLREVWNSWNKKLSYWEDSLSVDFIFFLTQFRRSSNHRRSSASYCRKSKLSRSAILYLSILYFSWPSFRKFWIAEAWLQILYF